MRDNIPTLQSVVQEALHALNDPAHSYTLGPETHYSPNQAIKKLEGLRPHGLFFPRQEPWFKFQKNLWPSCPDPAKAFL